jgi:hypothetical protein
MSKLLTLNSIEDSSIIDDILNDELIIIEDIQGSKIWVNWNGSEFQIRTKSVNGERINLVDLAMQNYYNPVFNYFSGLDNRVKSLLNKKWWFCFEFFPDEQPANITYSRTPKNGLVITSIYKQGKYGFNIDEILEYARLFEVDYIPIVYQGKLTETMKEAILYFLNTSEEDLEFVFGDKSFSYFFYKILNPKTSNSFLMDGEFQPNLQKLLIRSKTRDISFELLNPLYKRANDSNTTEFVEIYTLILINFLNFCQSVNLEDIKIKGETFDEMYIFLMSKIFNIYMNEVKEDIENFDFVVPNFFDKDKFKINTELIKNKTTKEYISEHPKFEYIFKVILGSFSKKKKKPIGIFSENTVTLFNKFVDEIRQYIDRYLERIQEIELGRVGLLDFSDFFDIKYDTDAEGQVYPDVYDEFEKEPEETKKSKGKKAGLFTQKK